MTFSVTNTTANVITIQGVDISQEETIALSLSNIKTWLGDLKFRLSIEMGLLIFKFNGSALLPEQVSRITNSILIDWSSY